MESARRHILKIEIKGLDELQRRLARMQRAVQATASRLNQTVVETPLGRDEDGFLDRSCPSCAFVFKVSGETPSESMKACPSCGHSDPTARWETPAQLEQAKANARAHAESAVRGAFPGKRSPFPGFTQASLGVRPAFSGLSPAFSFVRTPGQGIMNFRSASSAAFGVNVMRGGRWVIVGIPAAATAALRSQRSCPECGCRFSFVGSAFFCPGCGVAPAQANFAQSIIAVRRAITQCGLLLKALSTDDAANIERALLEKAMADLVTGFQLVGESLYQRLTGVPAPTNAFQRLDGPKSGDALWRAATGHNYRDYIGDEGTTMLRKYFQRRHLLAHTNGFVDQSYLDRSGDRDYVLGQRLVVRRWEVEEFAKLVECLSTRMGLQQPST
jgi:hypothetical protein